MAHRELEKMGPMKRTEKVMAFVFILILGLWATSEWNKMDATVVTLIGLSIMLVTGVIRWDDVIAEKGALNAGITHYGTGPAPIYFNAGYLDQKTWWKLGLILSFVNIAIWMGVGFPWWRILGLW